MKTKGKLLLTLFLIMWVAIAFTLLKNEGSRIIGKSYFESNQFQDQTLILLKNNLDNWYYCLLIQKKQRIHLR
ncbi:histidine kinase OS=Ureibacillus acetophenoni OX=614649 GN=SAMN05877842_1126 PE=4 SV=1 [Ureibacillus acetophenoni]